MPMPQRRSTHGHPIEDVVTFGFVLTDDFSLLAFTGFIDALRELDDHGSFTRRQYCSWAVLGDPNAPVRSSCGVLITPWKPLAHAADYDYVVVVGGRTQARIDDAAVAFLRKAGAGTTKLIGIDTGTFVLARAGLMDGHLACVHWFHYQEYLQEFPHLRATSEEIFVDEGGRITCAGGTCSIDLAAYLIAKTWGPLEAARAIALMGLERMRSPQHHQAPFFTEAHIVHDPNVRRAIQIMETSCNGPLSVEEVASQLFISPRQLERAFQRTLGIAPNEFFRRQRLRHGHWLLSNTPRSVAQVANDCGFADSSHFSRHFKREFGITPSVIRVKDERKAYV